MFLGIIPRVAQILQNRASGIHERVKSTPWPLLRSGKPFTLFIVSEIDLPGGLPGGPSRLAQLYQLRPAEQELIAGRPRAGVLGLVRDHLLAREPRLVWLQGASSGEILQALVQAIRGRFGRPLLLLDGHALCGSSTVHQAAALRRLRRDADL